VFELFSVPLDGSADPVRLHAPLAAGRAVSSFQISPDGARVVFRADLLVKGRIDLFSVPTDGRFAPQKLDGAVHPLGDVTDFAISPDGRTVVYRANVSGAPQYDLFSVPVQGHRALRRSGGEAGAGVVRLTQVASRREVAPGFSFCADGNQVLYRANVTRGTTFDVFRVAVDGSSAPVRLSDVGADHTTTSFASSPDQSRVVYIANAVLPGAFELFSVPFGGGPSVRLDPPIPLPSVFREVSSFRIDAHSRRVVYLADRDVDEVRELFAVPIDGSAPAERLNGRLPTGGDVESGYALLPGGRVLYRADQEKNDLLELFVSLERPVLPR